MKKAKKRKEKLTIYLVKDGVTAQHRIIDIDKAKEPYKIDIEGSEGTLYVKKDPPKPPPPWTKLFTDSYELPDGLFGQTKTVGAALVIKIKESLVVLTFGMGFHLLHNQSIERDFGLRVTLNSVVPDKLRSIDRAAFDHNPLNSRTQSSIELDVFDLEMDSESDLLYAITGLSNTPLFGSHVTGRDSLTLAVETNISRLKDILAEAIRRYKQPLPKEFEWVDNVRRVKDKDLIGALDLELDKLLAEEETENVWLGEPEVIDWEAQIGYSFDTYPKTPRHVVLQLSELKQYFIDKGKEFNCDHLKTQLIHINNNEYSSEKSWPAYRCIYAEIFVGNERYILRNGTWYRVDPTFEKSIDGYLSTLDSYPYTMPIYSFDKEEDYNKHVGRSDPNIQLMDKKFIKVGGPYDKIEFCDLIRNNTEFIHVKYYRSSATLSHLFFQGLVGSEAFIKDEEFREKLNEKLPVRSKLNNTNVRPDPKKYTIVYGIATNKNLPKELPFFSKITLKNTAKTLKAYGFNICLSAIEVDPAIKKKKKCKPEKKKKLIK